MNTLQSKWQTQSLESSTLNSNSETVEADLQRRLYHAPKECRDDEFRSESAYLAPYRHRGQEHESLLARRFREREQQHHEEVTAIQKDQEVVKSLVQTSSEQNQEHLMQIDRVSTGRQVHVA